MATPIVKFRAKEEDLQTIKESVHLLKLASDSAAIRVLLRQGKKAIEDFYNMAWNVARPLKYSEIDYLTTSMNIWLKKKKREIEQQK